MLSNVYNKITICNCKLGDEMRSLKWMTRASSFACLEDSQAYSLLSNAYFSSHGTPRYSLLKLIATVNTKPSISPFSNHQSNGVPSTSENDPRASWITFKSLINKGHLPNKVLVNDLLIRVLSESALHDLKRAFAGVLIILEKYPHNNLLEFDTLETVLQNLTKNNLIKPAILVLKAILKNGSCPPISMWGASLEKIAEEKSTAFYAIEICLEICRKNMENSSECEHARRVAFNSFLCACLNLDMVSHAEEMIQRSYALGINPNVGSFGLLAQLYAKLGLHKNVASLEDIMRLYGIIPEQQYYAGLVLGYLTRGDLESASKNLLFLIRNEFCSDNEDCGISKVYDKFVREFLDKERDEDLVGFVIQAQGAESAALSVVTDALIRLGCLEKAHSILDKLYAKNLKAGIGPWSSVLRAYCKENKTTKASKMIGDLRVEVRDFDYSNYDEVIDACISAKDYESAILTFRKMKERGIAEIHTSYMTIMTGLTEGRKPDLMAALLYENFLDSRIKVGTNDWNSVIHSFCQIGCLSDARKTFQTMLKSRFEANENTYLPLVNAYRAKKMYCDISSLSMGLRKSIYKALKCGQESPLLNTVLLDKLLHALLFGGQVAEALQVIKMTQRLNISVNKWRCQQVFLERQNSLEYSYFKKKNTMRWKVLMAFKKSVGLPVIRRTSMQDAKKSVDN